MDALLVVGTTGATNLPNQVGEMFARRKAPILVFNPEANPFTDLVDDRTGAFVSGQAGTLIPAFVDAWLGA